MTILELRVASRAADLTGANPSMSRGLPAGMNGGYPAGAAARRGAFSFCMRFEKAQAR